MSLQVRLELEPREKRQFAFLTLAAGSRETLLDLAERYATLASLDWAIGNAATEAARETQSLGLEPERLPELQTLASLLIHPHPALRAKPSEIAANRLGQPGLWRFGLSGDLPILLLRADEPSEMDLLRVLIRAHRLWRRRGLHLDLVVIRTGVSGYMRSRARERPRSASRNGRTRAIRPQRRRAPALCGPDEQGRDMSARSRCACRPRRSRGPLAQQLAAAAEPRPRPPRFEPSGASMPDQTDRRFPGQRACVSTTASVVLRRTAGNMQSTSGRGSTRLLPGATFSPTTGSAASSPKRAEDLPGWSTAGRIALPPGRTIRSPTRRAKRFTCATRRPPRFGPDAAAGGGGRRMRD